MTDVTSAMVPTDVHQHLWPEGFLSALAGRAAAPLRFPLGDRAAVVTAATNVHRLLFGRSA
jgi:hypothetical protein